MASKTETIDPRILRLIGLEDVFDLDYGTYASLLKEALVKPVVVDKSKKSDLFRSSVFLKLVFFKSG